MIKGVPKIFQTKKRPRRQTVTEYHEPTPPFHSSSNNFAESSSMAEEDMIVPVSLTEDNVHRDQELRAASVEHAVPVPPPSDQHGTRMHEQFSDNGRHVDDDYADPPHHIREAFGDNSLYEGPRSILNDSLSAGRAGSNQRVTFIGDLGEDPLERRESQSSRHSGQSTASKYSQGTETAARNYSQASHSQYGRRHYDEGRNDRQFYNGRDDHFDDRHYDDRRYDDQHYGDRRLHDRRVLEREHGRQRLPYMLLVDFGNGLEIGNEIDGFMPYEDYAAYKEEYGVDQETYYIIPGNTPVVFHDEDGKEIFRVDAHKYSKHMRKHKFIIQDEFGNEIRRIGHSRFMAGASNSGSNSSRSNSPRSPNSNVIHLDGRDSPVYRSGTPRSDYTNRSDTIPIINEDGHRMYSRSRGKGHHDRHDQDRNRPNYVFVDEYGQPVQSGEEHQGRSFGHTSDSGSSGSGGSSYKKIRRAPVLYL